MSRLKSCKYCGRIHDNKLDCGKKPKPTREVKEIDKFRWSRKWKGKRNDIVERDNHLCLVCKEDNVYNYNDLEVHHIIPLAEDYDKRLDDDNLITLCHFHHQRAELGDIKIIYLQGLVKEYPPTML